MQIQIHCLLGRVHADCNCAPNLPPHCSTSHDSIVQCLSAHTCFHTHPLELHNVLFVQSVHRAADLSSYVADNISTSETIKMLSRGENLSNFRIEKRCKSFPRHWTKTVSNLFKPQTQQRDLRFM